MLSCENCIHFYECDNMGYYDECQEKFKTFQKWGLTNNSEYDNIKSENERGNKNGKME